MPLGISDHYLVYETLKLGSKRPLPKIIRTRNFKNLNAANFKADIEKIPFHILEIFHHKDDALWGWELLFKDICNAHAPFKDVKVRSMSALWINNTSCTSIDIDYMYGILFGVQELLLTLVQCNVRWKGLQCKWTDLSC